MLTARVTLAPGFTPKRSRSEITYERVVVLVVLIVVYIVVVGIIVVVVVGIIAIVI